MLSRRLFLKLGLCGAFVNDVFALDGSLKNIAAKKGLLFGLAVNSKALREDAKYSEAVISDSGLIVPEWEMKWGAVERNVGVRDFSKVDYILKFAQINSLLFRGHTAIWGHNLPKWIRQLNKSSVDNAFVAHIEDIFLRYKNSAVHWDVVNEAIEPKHGRGDFLRKSFLLDKLGPDYVGRAFFIAAQNDQKSKKYYNDYGFWADTSEHATRRYAVLKLLERLVRFGAPIDGFGIQSHLIANQADVNQVVLRKFFDEVSSFGLDIMVTELDVSDKYIPSSVDIHSRDIMVSDVLRKYIDVVLDNVSTKGVVVWGVSDRYSYMNSFNKQNQRYNREDGEINRSLLLDVDFKKKNLWFALADCFSRARNR